MKRILNYPGSKWRLAEQIIDLIPEHTTYLEPFFGSGAVFFSKDPSTVETINDLDQRVVNFFRVCREQPEKLVYAVNMTPHSRYEQQHAREIVQDPLEMARLFLIDSWQSIGGVQRHHTGWRSNIDKIGGKLQEWNEIDDRIWDVAERLKHAQIENQDALKLLRRYNRKDVCAYVDPPYVLNTRKGRLYQTELGDERQEELLAILNDFKGSVILSGYESELYNQKLAEWHKIYFDANAEAGQSRNEVIWCNFEPSGQTSLFEQG